MLSILKNTEIIAINQDPVHGTSISPFRWGINVGIMNCSLGCSNDNCSLIGLITLRSLLSFGVVQVRMARSLCL